MSNPTAEDRETLGLAALPADVVAILLAEDAPPRLHAHLTLVHDVARQLMARVNKAWAGLAVDAANVAFGAASHDIGKARHPDELSGPGCRHEAEGERLLLERGIPPARARFARTHGADRATLGLDDLLVVLADTCWKGKRDRAVEEAVAAAIAAQTGQPIWKVFMKLDGIVEAVAADADGRLEWQGLFPLRS
jgi:hypothetical protein